jgi:hypothetical protein
MPRYVMGVRRNEATNSASAMPSQGGMVSHHSATFAGHQDSTNFFGGRIRAMLDRLKHSVRQNPWVVPLVNDPAQYADATETLAMQLFTEPPSLLRGLIPEQATLDEVRWITDALVCMRATDVNPLAMVLTHGVGALATLALSMASDRRPDQRIAATGLDVSAERTASSEESVSEQTLDRAVRLIEMSAKRSILKIGSLKADSPLSGLLLRRSAPISSVLSGTYVEKTRQMMHWSDNDVSDSEVRNVLQCAARISRANNLTVDTGRSAHVPTTESSAGSGRPIDQIELGWAFYSAHTSESRMNIARMNIGGGPISPLAQWPRTHMGPWQTPATNEPPIGPSL